MGRNRSGQPAKIIGRPRTADNKLERRIMRRWRATTAPNEINKAPDEIATPRQEQGKAQQMCRSQSQRVQMRGQSFLARTD
jgi:hypothetical protein